MGERNIRAASVRLATISNAELSNIASRDPDMIRDVARAMASVFGPAWEDHTLRCALNDDQFGPCSCGAIEKFIKMIGRHK
jgi:hypothetical protein